MTSSLLETARTEALAELQNLTTGIGGEQYVATDDPATDYFRPATEAEIAARAFNLLVSTIIPESGKPFEGLPAVKLYMNLIKSINS